MFLGRRALGTALALAVALMAAAPAQAQGLVLSTRYPGVTVKAGQKVSLPLEVSGKGIPEGPVDLQVTELPKGWQMPVFRGGGYEVSQVFVGQDKTESVSLDLEVPPQTPNGTYRLTVVAKSPFGQSTLPLLLRVSEQGAQLAELTSQYPALEGPADATYQFRLTLRNNANEQRLFSLSAEAPKGWEVVFRPAYDSKRIASIPVDANSSQNLDVEVRPPKETAAGNYTIKVQATAGNATATTDLQVKVLGSFALQLTTPTGRLNASVAAGDTSPVKLVVKNTGSAPVTRINLSSTAPPGWSVTFRPASIDTLGPGESREVEAQIKADSRAIAGDYVVSVSASGQEASSSADLRVTVRTRTVWGLVGLAIIALVAGGVAWVFRTYGRR